MTALTTEIMKLDSLHFLGAVVTDNSVLLSSPTEFMRHTREVLLREGVTCLGENYFGFEFDGEQSGFTAVFMLAESHIAIHTWPEYKVAELDVYLCNYMRDNRQKCERIFNALATYFSPSFTLKNPVKRPRADRIVAAGVKK